MSDPSDTYTCPVCTYVQAIEVPRCEMCESANSHRTKSSKKEEVIPSANSSACPKCAHVNRGDFVRVCERCDHSFANESDSSKRSHSDEEEEEEEEEEDEEEEEYFDFADGADETYPISLPQNKDKKRKSIEAVEKAMDDEELKSYFHQYLSVLQDERQQTRTFTEQQLHQIILQLFRSLQYRSEQSEGQLVFRACQICYDKDEPMVTMSSCGHRVICIDDFHQYLSTRIRDGEILPWIPCPAEICSVPCSAENMVNDGRLSHGQLLSFITTYMSKKLARNENYISCVQCEQGGFLQFGAPKKEEVTCSICQVKQTIEKGTDGDLDITFKQMIQSGLLRECPTCRHLTLKEKGLCNVIECAKCGVWWNWRTREQGHNGKDLKQRARTNGTLWEPGELQYQQELERRNPQEFKALLERNGIAYDPNYVRGGWNEQ